MNLKQKNLFEIPCCRINANRFGYIFKYSLTETCKCINYVKHTLVWEGLKKTRLFRKHVPYKGGGGEAPPPEKK